VRFTQRHAIYCLGNLVTHKTLYKCTYLPLWNSENYAYVLISKMSLVAYGCTFNRVIALLWNGHSYWTWLRGADEITDVMKA
jgi:hypothetical protein